VLLVAHVVLDIVFNHISWWWLALVLFGYITLLVSGSIYIRWNFYMTAQNKLPALQFKRKSGGISLETNDKQIALTFDDGPSLHTPAVLDILKQYKAVATFFLIGNNITGKEAIVKRMVLEGHSVGNHSFYHGFSFDWQSAGKMLAEMDACNLAIKNITGSDTVLFRPPYGVTNPNLAKAVRRSGMRSIGWSLRSMDTVAKNEEQLLSKITGNLKSGDIILLHDRCDITVKILPRLIKQLAERGFSFVTV
jgi:peptidoglycan/xylan/chitin deacetylase (PgdA/CDA1 family)